MMFLFSIMEVFNKLSGFVILSLYSRILGVELFGEFTAILVIFGYFVEFSYFSYQPKNLAETTRLGSKYIYSEIFRLRVKLVFFISLVSAIIFYIANKINTQLNLTPLFIVISLSCVNFDYLLYGSNNASYVIFSRFVGQVFLLLTVFCMYYFDFIMVENIFLIQLLHTAFLMGLVIYFCHLKKMFSFSNIISLAKYRIKLRLYLFEIQNQTPIFLFKLIVLILVTVELPLLMYFDNNTYQELAVGHRITLILLPFLLFYLNTNLDKVSESELKKIVVFSSVLSCGLILISPIIVLMLFGKDYMLNLQSYSNYYYLIVFQVFINYTFYISIKYGNESKGFKMIAIAFSCYLVVFFSYNYWQDITQQSLVLLCTFKVFLVVMLSIYSSFREKILITVMICCPIILSVLLGEFYYFEFSENMLNFVINAIRL
ncbi:hypothetical protein [Shewanella salipaludis]|uniref:Polysaccharide biosynthesis protein n=1 Tax=Shewanella salipaludis TaxID=2723052 RepID=A0A972JIR8_9GAMM|nr:hypothetical protein [Shewanella salipaludis]NMH65363.1 hypothetical protein [Shewanella salipaludis]